MSALSAPERYENKNTAIDKAATIYQYTRIAAVSMLVTFDALREARGAERGMTTDQEQDILRAVLVFAGAGLDSTLKQLTRDALSEIPFENQGKQSGLERFLQRKIKGSENELGVEVKYLAKLFSAPWPYRKALEDYIQELNGDSLQSAEQLLKILSTFGIDQKVIGFSMTDLKPAFRARNEIVHEMDIDLNGARRRRRIRTLDQMIQWADMILKITYSTVKAVDDLLPHTPSWTTPVS